MDLMILLDNLSASYLVKSLDKIKDDLTIIL